MTPDREITFTEYIAKHRTQPFRLYELEGAGVPVVASEPVMTGEEYDYSDYCHWEASERPQEWWVHLYG